MDNESTDDADANENADLLLNENAAQLTDELTINARNLPAELIENVAETEDISPALTITAEVNADQPDNSTLEVTTETTASNVPLSLPTLGARSLSAATNLPNWRHRQNFYRIMRWPSLRHMPVSCLSCGRPLPLDYVQRMDRKCKNLMTDISNFERRLWEITHCIWHFSENFDATIDPYQQSNAEEPSEPSDAERHGNDDDVDSFSDDDNDL